MTVRQCHRHAGHGPHEWYANRYGDAVASTWAEFYFDCPGNGPFMEGRSPGHRRVTPEMAREMLDRIRPSPAATAAPTSQEGGENIMHLILNIDGVNHEFTEVTDAPAAAAAPATLTIKRPFVVYDVNGDRVDGYKYESRARRNNDARFAGVGYWLGNANTGDFEFVSA